MFKEIKDKKFKDYDPEIIAWQRETKEDLGTPLMYSYPQPKDNIKNKKFFAVKDYEKALFYNKGKFIGALGGGIYELDKKARIKGTEIVWIDTSLLNIPWGIPIKNGFPTKDDVLIGLHGDLKLSIQNTKTFYKDIVAGKKEWTVQDIKDWIMTLLHTSLRDIFKNYFVKQIILEERERVINLITAKVTEEFIRYGLELETFNIIGLKTTKEVQEIIDHDKKGKNRLQVRIKELDEKKNELQNLLLNDKITQEDYDKKREQIEIFIKEAQEELRKNEI
ncbi:hypothetical protein LCGC14_1234930 [marine sediment metagenome]|uniref:Band 7 domain-containing protein n=1 Tax=marine sediment metagenome TaxID=412755 RepID=A0A0F9NPQ5_9ZZZZ